jgi:hypothetical protein
MEREVRAKKKRDGHVPASEKFSNSVLIENER